MVETIERRIAPDFILSGLEPATVILYILDCVYSLPLGVVMNRAVHGIIKGRKRYVHGENILRNSREIFFQHHAATHNGYYIDR